MRRIRTERSRCFAVVLPIVHAGRSAELRLGFDEQPTQERIHLALNRMLMVLAVYFGVAMVIAILLSRRMSRPIHRLQDVSRSIASGDYAQALQVTTGIRELHELAADLEGMRRELVGVNHRLQAKIKEKEISEIRREQLQKQLRHRQRLETVGTLAGCLGLSTVLFSFRHATAPSREKRSDDKGKNYADKPLHDKGLAQLTEPKSAPDSKPYRPFVESGFPRRALVISVHNYLYANPVGSGR